MTWNDLRLRIRALLLHRRAEEELDEELRFHLEMDARKHGSDTRRRFGSIDRVKEECRSVRGTQWIETSLRDMQYALRGFRRNPLFVLTVIGTIALGLGLNVALFTLFDTIVLRPFAVRDPYSLYTFTWTDRSGNYHAFSWREFEKFRESNPVFSEVLAAHYLQGRMSGHPARGFLVTGNYFQMLGGSAHLGRLLTPEDAAAPGREPVVVLSYNAWQYKFSRDPNIIGKRVLLHGYPLEVVGIVSREFTGLAQGAPDFWVPLSMASQLENGPDLFGPDKPQRLMIIGRLRPNWLANPAQAALAVWSKQATSDLPEAERAAGVLLQSQAPMGILLTREAIMLFSPLFAAFGLVLLITCANVANIMLARSMARQREIGIRLSLGAGRSRLIRQLLAESVLLAVPAGLASLFVSRAVVDGTLRIIFATMPSDLVALVPSFSLPLDFRVFVFAAIAALLTAVLFGLAPAMQATRQDVMAAARGEFTRDSRPMRFRNVLVIGQITVCVLFLICSGVLIRSDRAAHKLNVGYQTHGVIFMTISEKSRAKLLSRLAAEPSVEEVAAASTIPLNDTPPALNISTGGPNAVRAWRNSVSPEFFDVLRIPIVEGRNFTADEAKAGAQVAIVSELAARSLWPKDSSVGREIQIAGDWQSGKQQPGYRAVRIIGVAKNIITAWVDGGSDPPLVYFPVSTRSQNPLLLRVRGDVESVRRQLIEDLDRTLPGAVEEDHPMDQWFAKDTYLFSMASWIGLALAVLALLLTLSGIYGVLSYLITQRTKEIGIRMALGATTSAVMWLVLRQSAKLALIGIATGAALALGVSRLLASQLVFINTFDVFAYSSGILLVIGATLAAGFVPTRRATRIDPVTTLRYD